MVVRELCSSSNRRSSASWVSARNALRTRAGIYAQVTIDAGGAGEHGDDPFGRVVDLQVASEIVGGHHNRGQPPERHRGHLERRTVQLQGGGTMRRHAGEYNAPIAAFRRWPGARIG